LELSDGILVVANDAGFSAIGNIDNLEGILEVNKWKIGFLREGFEVELVNS
jgi:hypothetical protein